MSRSILDQWANHENRAEQLERLLDALETWTRWANGHDVAGDRLTRSVATVGHHGSRVQQADFRGVVAIVQLWAAQAGLELASPDAIDRDLPTRTRCGVGHLGLGL